MAITIGLLSENTKNLENFLQKYYEKKIILDHNTVEWAYVYNDTLEAIELLGIAAENHLEYGFSVYIQSENGCMFTVTFENCNDIIKALLYLYYNKVKGF